MRALRCRAVSHWIARALHEISEFKVIPKTPEAARKASPRGDQLGHQLLASLKKMAFDTQRQLKTPIHEAKALKDKALAARRHLINSKARLQLEPGTALMAAFAPGRHTGRVQGDSLQLIAYNIVVRMLPFWHAVLEPRSV